MVGFRGEKAMRFWRSFTGGRSVDTRNPHEGDLELARAWLRSRLESLHIDLRVIEALMSVRREEFTLPENRPNAYDDEAMSIGHGQTISQPSLVARMVEHMRVEPGHVVLDVGTGSGYQAAILARLAERVVGVEREPALCQQAKERLAALGYGNVEVYETGHELGWPEGGPYDSIVVGAAAPKIPDSLVKQLKIGGRLVIPVGDREQQIIAVVTKTTDGVDVAHKEYVRFVPLIGEDAWDS